jgi:phosphoglycolate phosphatase-like HAD superfamily hydrolase
MNPKPPTVIVDVDGTLVDVTSVRHYVLSNPKDFDHFHAGAELCPPIESTFELLAGLRENVSIQVVTARKQRWEHTTRRWLRKWGVEYDRLYMRGDDDGRPDVEVKRDILARIRRDHRVTLAIDDNPRVIALWQAEGIPTVVVPGWVAGVVPCGDVLVGAQFAPGTHSQHYSRNVASCTLIADHDGHHYDAGIRYAWPTR